MGLGEDEKNQKIVHAYWIQTTEWINGVPTRKKRMCFHL